MLLFDLPEISSWEYIISSNKPVVIYGMGNGADMVLDELMRLGVNVYGITASDDFVRGQTFRGFTVKKLSEFSGDFILAIAFGSGLQHVINHILELQCEYDVIVPVVPVIGNEIFNRSFVEKHEDRINYAYKLFSGRSRLVYENCIKFTFSGRLSYLIEITDEKDEIFKNFLSLSSEDSYVDVGAYKGDTVLEFLSYTNGKHNGIIAVEPDEKSFKKLKDRFSEDDGVLAVCKAISDYVGFLKFNAKAGRQSRASENGKQIECTTIDELCTEINVSYIKIDVEGLEYKALIGGKNTLRNQKPKLNIALYHRSEDIFELPILIHELNPAYKMEIRRHPYIPCWDLNLYCK